MKDINQGIKDAITKLESLKTGINNIDDKIQELSKGIFVIKETNEGLQEMNMELDDFLNILTDALDKTEKVDDYIENFKMQMTVGMAVIILAIITLIGLTFVKIRRKK